MWFTGAFDKIIGSIFDTIIGARISIAELHFIPVPSFLVNFTRFRIFHFIYHYFSFNLIRFT